MEKKYMNFGVLRFAEARMSFPYGDSANTFQRLYQDYQYKMLLESKDISPVYGRMSLVGVDPVLALKGKDNRFEIKALNERGAAYLEGIKDIDLKMAENVSRTETHISGTIKNELQSQEESQRAHKPNIAQVIRLFLKKFKTTEKTLLGLYGPFAYDFVRLFEDIGNTLPESEIDDFRLFLYDTFIQIDHIKEGASIVCYRSDEVQATQAVEALQKKLQASNDLAITPAEISNAKFFFSKNEYEDLVRKSKEYITQGEVFEIVFANTLQASFQGDPFELYLRYRENNPSPYMFYFDMGEDQLVGASPEMMVRCEEGMVSVRPISGTARRGANSIEDYENMMTLLNSKKEKAELDMLVDLGRNDLTRVCQPGITVSDYRFVEKYSKVMHTVTQLEGRLRSEYTAFDALVSTLNNGTLTGAPKVRAMQLIEQDEKRRRGYYGGALGYLTFDDRMDTCITIRTAHIKDGSLIFPVGASLVYDSEPAAEYQETLNKASAFLSTVHLAEKELGKEGC